MDIFSNMLRSVHKTLAVPVAVSGLADSVMMIDKTAGVEIEPRPGVSIPTLVPAVAVRRAELEQYGLTPAMMIGRIIVVNGQTWTVQTSKPSPTPEGALKGEYLLTLRG